MGYRSDVAAAFYTADKKHFPVLKLWLDENFPWKYFDTDDVEWFDKGMVFRVESVKWYDSYPDVDAFTEAQEQFVRLVNALDEGEDERPVFCYEFVRIGENFEDIEATHEGEAVEWILDVERHVRISIPN